MPLEPRSEINVIQNVEAFKGHLIAKRAANSGEREVESDPELADPVIRCRERLHVRRQASTSLVKNVRRRLHQGCTRACLADRPVQMGGVRGGIPHPLAGRGLKLFGCFPRAARRLCAQLVVPSLHKLEALRDVIPRRRSAPAAPGTLSCGVGDFTGAGSAKRASSALLKSCRRNADCQAPEPHRVRGPVVRSTAARGGMHCRQFRATATGRVLSRVRRFPLPDPLPPRRPGASLADKRRFPRIPPSSRGGWSIQRRPRGRPCFRRERQFFWAARSRSSRDPIRRQSPARRSIGRGRPGGRK